MSKRVGIIEAAKLAGLSEYALRAGIRAGRYPHMRVGTGCGKILIDVDLLNQAIEMEMKSSIKAPQLDSSEMVEYGLLRRVIV